jgi:transcriptional regulator with XRE-family HTH domain
MLAVKKPLHGQRSKIFCDHIRSLRVNARMTQRDLSEALGREHGMVARIELGERRVDMIEAFDLFEALGADPIKEAQVLMKKFKDVM